MRNVDILRSLSDDAIAGVLAKIYLTVPHGINYEDAKENMLEMLMEEEDEC